MYVGFRHSERSPVRCHCKRREQGDQSRGNLSLYKTVVVMRFSRLRQSRPVILSEATARERSREDLAVLPTLRMTE